MAFKVQRKRNLNMSAYGIKSFKRKEWGCAAVTSTGGCVSWGKRTKNKKKIAET